ncbi:MAG TPA: hypothetical protein VLJ88_19415, partial [Propionibacteriaceae bacterium]|nr:hypothetical protein [Propionibacteriaceae bacterium]
ISMGTGGIGPTDSRKGWLEYFIAAAVEYEVVRLIPVFEIPDIAIRMLPYVQTVGGSKHGASVLNRALFQSLPDGLASSVWHELRPMIDQL